MCDDRQRLLSPSAQLLYHTKVYRRLTDGIQKVNSSYELVATLSKPYQTPPRKQLTNCETIRVQSKTSCRKGDNM